MSDTPEDPERELAELADQQSPGIVREFIDSLRTSKKWWLAPVIVLLLILGVFVLLAGTPIGPFLYTLF